jgi:DNA-binding HxlR family transcriptional regulator
MSSPAALDWSVDNCTIGRTLDVIGDRWTFLVLREVFNGIRRFDDLTVRTAIPRTVLTDRLRRLVDAGILRKEPYREPGARSRMEYRLTEKGLDLYPVLVAIMKWGDRWKSKEQPPVRLVHKLCDHDADPKFVCGHCGQELAARDVRAEPGPGLSSAAA